MKTFLRIWLNFGTIVSLFVIAFIFGVIANQIDNNLWYSIFFWASVVFSLATALSIITVLVLKLFGVKEI